MTNAAPGGPAPVHPVADLLLRAWRGPRQPVDGSWSRTPSWRDGVHAVVSVTGRAVVTAPDDVTDTELADLGVDGWGHAHDPRVMTRLAGRDGWVDVLDAVLLAEGTGAPDPRLVLRPDLRDHPRVHHALPIRGDVRVFGLEGDDTTVLTLATGLGGLTEMSFEVGPTHRGAGLGTALAAAARGLVPAGHPVVACVSPGNVPSLRALLTAGFEPVGSVQVYRPDR
ncbi:N-acetyltransferase [Oryzobacter telluris]|uniref:N-acetyltransferase n=1 Tax=Oryzobacter telluris TaxID=3149179 RepID=UPI00370D6DF6